MSLIKTRFYNRDNAHFDAAGDAAELRAGRSAAGENHGIGMKLFCTAAQSVYSNTQR